MNRLKVMVRVEGCRYGRPCITQWHVMLSFQVFNRFVYILRCNKKEFRQFIINDISSSQLQLHILVHYILYLVFASSWYNIHKLLPFFTSRVFFCFRNCRQTAGRPVIYSPPKALQPSPSTLARTRHPLQTLQDWGSDDLRGSEKWAGQNTSG